MGFVSFILSILSVVHFLYLLLGLPSRHCPQMPGWPTPVQGGREEQAGASPRPLQGRPPTAGRCLFAAARSAHGVGGGVWRGLASLPEQSCVTCYPSEVLGGHSKLPPNQPQVPVLPHPHPGCPAKSASTSHLKFVEIPRLKVPLPCPHCRAGGYTAGTPRVGHSPAKEVSAQSTGRDWLTHVGPAPGVPAVSPGQGGLCSPQRQALAGEGCVCGVSREAWAWSQVQAPAALGTAGRGSAQPPREEGASPPPAPLWPGPCNSSQAVLSSEHPFGRTGGRGQGRPLG